MPDHRGCEPKELMRGDIERIRAALRQDLKSDKFGTVRKMAHELDVSRSEVSLLTRPGESYRYKRNGLSKKIIERLLKAVAISEEIKALVREYLSKKRAGLYGHEPCEGSDPTSV